MSGEDALLARGEAFGKIGALVLEQVAQVVVAERAGEGAAFASSVIAS